MSKHYILTACLFWVFSLASAQVMLPAYQGVFGKKVVTGTIPSAPSSPVATSGYKEAIVSFTAPISDGGSAVTGYTVTSTPEGFTASGAASPITVTGLINGTSYTFKVVATNALGNSLASPPSISIKIFYIGMPFQGGKLAYIFTSVDPGYVDGEGHGLIAATSNSFYAARWTPYGSPDINTGATGTAIGTGFSNTNAIIASHATTASSAAGVARAHSGGGYTDWYLPSIDELRKLYSNRVLIGNFYDTYPYWSSSETSSKSAIAHRFEPYKNQFSSFKDNGYYVRAVRTF